MPKTVLQQSKNETISLEIVTIKWKGQLTKRFIKNGEGKQAKWKYGRFSVDNMTIDYRVGFFLNDILLAR